MSARQSPAPSPPPPSQHPAYAGGMPAMATNFLPNTANQADMQHVLNLVKELSDIQAANRQETARIIQNIHVLGDRQSRKSGQLQAPSEGQEPAVAEAQSSTVAAAVNPVDHARLQHQLSQVTQERDDLKKAFDDVAETLTQYEDTLESIMVRVREFANQHTTSLIAWHKHYNTALQTERDANHQLRLEHSHWQESVGKLATYVRGAYDAQNTMLLPYQRQIAGLKRINKVLKRRCGLEYEESDDEEETAPPSGTGPASAPGIAGPPAQP